MRIVIAGEVDLTPGVREAALAGAAPFIAMALAEEGCRHYAWSADPALPDRVHVFEEWDDAATLQAHLEGDAYRAMLGHLGGFGIVAADTRKYRVTKQAPVYGADGVASARFGDEA
ncbi:putative quinol monooxygenase [Sandaracinobacteroides saxicola]|uniref:Antibiotic biosynthesis monooxygenase n=1 Tax=Sandaracinobacteroides saxicola TaxID=2759707 RepID=A0A7G5IGT9_9SPHN|nr:putative quinol monooxygenase [Sandaracinobacteroides saxicola]QMW22581.1 antibiotic biosynthesis monooxygenase [Sandaracinobacteroides saxicola]